MMEPFVADQVAVIDPFQIRNLGIALSMEPAHIGKIGDINVAGDPFMLKPCHGPEDAFGGE